MGDSKKCLTIVYTHVVTAHFWQLNVAKSNVCFDSIDSFFALLLQTVRQKLYDELTKINQDRDWSFILKQIGEFSQICLLVASISSYKLC